MSSTGDYCKQAESQYTSHCVYWKGMEKGKENTRWREKDITKNMGKKKPQNEGQTDSGILNTIEMKRDLICFLLVLYFA